jgi:hypothetical protein
VHLAGALVGFLAELAASFPWATRAGILADLLAKLAGNIFGTLALAGALAGFFARLAGQCYG